MAEPYYYRASFGDQPLLLARVATPRGRDQVVHSPTEGSKHVVQDRGTVPIRVRCSVVFVWGQPGDSPRAQAERLRAQVDDKPRIFSHPIDGAFLARVEGYEEELDVGTRITAEVTFIRVEELAPVALAGAGTIPAAGAGAVDQAAADFAAELATSRMAAGGAGIADLARAAADAWASGSSSPTQVYADLGAASSRLNAFADTMTGDLDLWPLYARTLLLAEALRSAAEASTADQAATFVVHIAQPIALRQLLASVYGGDEVEGRYAQVMAMNEIAIPLAVEAGRDLVLPQQPARARIG